MLGDFGALRFDVIYERTFLCALPTELRLSYPKRMAPLLRAGGRLVGIFLDGTPSFNVTLQHHQKLLQLLLSLRGRMGVFNAMLHVGVNQRFRQRLEGFSRGNQLHQYLRAVAVFFEHPLNGVQLADDAAYPELLGVTLAAGMTVLFHASEG